MHRIDNDRDWSEGKDDTLIWWSLSNVSKCYDDEQKAMDECARKLC